MTDGCAAHQVEREELEGKNNELSSAYLEKAKALARQKKMYDTLKGQVMASQVAVAAGDEAEHTLQTVRGNRSLDRMPGVRSGTGVYSHPGVMQHPGGGRVHNRQGSGSSAVVSSEVALALVLLLPMLRICRIVAWVVECTLVVSQLFSSRYRLNVTTPLTIS